ncbi:GIY-YIG nuclease family protein [Winogradskyella tangerina]|uniref:GIY-YIG nuclease family protein n=1 Tax=Winogradskyella tangerina TaxID=2023240 RepID=UPI000DBEA0A7|nr:GIY-YIG nuclease family protein [Winogradskyella tangerina]
MENQNKTWCVYILSCTNGMNYVGCTNNLARRLNEHKSGKVISTSKKLPIKLITYLVFTDKYKAYKFEKYLKSGSGRAFYKKRLV